MTRAASDHPRGAAPRVAWITNDLPPSTGGIQQFVANLLARTATASTVVLGPAVVDPTRSRSAIEEDASHVWRTFRAPGRLLPTPAAARWLEAALEEHRPDLIVIASLWPLGLLAARLHRSSGVPILALTHGAEAGLARAPLDRVLRACARGVGSITTISDFTSTPISRVLGAERLSRLPPGVDVDRFTPRPPGDAEVAALRTRWGISERAPVVGCIARLVPRKGQDMLLAAWPDVLRRRPDARLVIVGEGPVRARLTRRAARSPSVHVVGPVTWSELPAAYAALDVFAMPVRTRWGGLDVEGLGISFLEAQASGLPVVVGRSGGASETLLDERCGTLVDGRSTRAISEAVLRWLDDDSARTTARRLGPELARAWSWDLIAARFQQLVDGQVGSSGRRSATYEHLDETVVGERRVEGAGLDDLPVDRDQDVIDLDPR
jgi:phosphatidyl-myo-inositol dimannoside synthase